MTEGQKTSAAKTAWHIVEDLPEIEDSSDWVSCSAHYSSTGEYEFSFEVLKLVSQVLVNALTGEVSYD